MKAIHSMMLQVCKKACAVNAHYRRFPKNWLFHYRWGKGRSAAEMTEERDDSSDSDSNDEAPMKGTKSYMPNGKIIEFLEVGGRTTAYVPSIQGKSPVSTKRSSAGSNRKRSVSSKGPTMPAMKRARSN